MLASSTVAIVNSLPFPKEGVRLSYFNDIIDSFGGRTALAGLTTTDVCNNFVKPACEALKASYCDYLSQTQIKHSCPVGKATVFISHAWKYVFLDVVEALQYHFRDDPDVIVWFDLFSNNQHQAVSLDFDWWCNTFKSAIEEFGHTVMIMAPWNDPIPLTRGWCLFELYCTAITNSRFEIAMSSTHRDKFFEDMIRDTTGEINRMLATIDAKKSECFKEEDKKRIFEVVT